MSASVISVISKSCRQAIIFAITKRDPLTVCPTITFGFIVIWLDSFKFGQVRLEYRKNGKLGNM